MKKILSLAVALIASASMFAQVSIVPKVGVNFSNITDSEGDTRTALVAGAEVMIPTAESTGITLGALYSCQGMDQRSIDYLNIPILAHYYLCPGLAVKAGGQVGILLNAKGGTDDLNTVDFSIPVGLSYEIGKVMIDARYNIGVTNVPSDTDLKGKNTAIQLTVGYKF